MMRRTSPPPLRRAAPAPTPKAGPKASGLSGLRVIQYRYLSKGRKPILRTVTAIAGPAGRNYTRVVWIDCPIKLLKIENDRLEKYATDVPYPLRKAAKAMLDAGKRLGITRKARLFLREIRRTK